MGLLVLPLSPTLNYSCSDSSIGCSSDNTLTAVSGIGEYTSLCADPIPSRDHQLIYYTGWEHHQQHQHYGVMLRSLTVGGGKSEWETPHLQPTCVQDTKKNMDAHAYLQEYKCLCIQVLPVLSGHLYINPLATDAAPRNIASPTGCSIAQLWISCQLQRSAAFLICRLFQDTCSI